MIQSVLHFCTENYTLQGLCLFTKNIKLHTHPPIGEMDLYSFSLTGSASVPVVYG